MMSLDVLRAGVDVYLGWEGRPGTVVILKPPYGEFIILDVFRPGLMRRASIYDAVAAFSEGVLTPGEIHYRKINALPCDGIAPTEWERAFGGYLNRTE